VETQVHYIDMKTHPDPFHVEPNTVCRYPLVIRRLEYIVLPRPVGEAESEILDRLFEFLWQKNLVG
jgi:hypothetical protein